MKYQNPDKRCRYPTDGNDYCWAYVHHVNNTGLRVLTDVCKECEYWKPETAVEKMQREHPWRTRWERLKRAFRKSNRP